MKRIIFIFTVFLCLIINLNAQIKNITSLEASDLLNKNHNFIVIDVRTVEEFKAGHIKGAININIKQSDAFSKIEKLDYKAKYIVYCRTANRSKKAVDYMISKGFTNIYHITDGFIGWLRNGLPVQKLSE